MYTRWFGIWLIGSVICLFVFWMSFGESLHFLMIYYAAVSVPAGGLYCWDKLISPSASGDERVPEGFFLFTGVAGTAPALLLLSLMIRHKIRKRRFQSVLLIMTMFHGLVFLSLSKQGVI